MTALVMRCDLRHSYQIWYFEEDALYDNETLVHVTTAFVHRAITSLTLPNMREYRFEALPSSMDGGLIGRDAGQGDNCQEVKNPAAINDHATKIRRPRRRRRNNYRRRTFDDCDKNYELCEGQIFCEEWPRYRSAGRFNRGPSGELRGSVKRDKPLSGGASLINILRDRNGVRSKPDPLYGGRVLLRALMDSPNLKPVGSAGKTRRTRRRKNRLAKISSIKTWSGGVVSAEEFNAPHRFVPLKGNGEIFADITKRSEEEFAIPEEKGEEPSSGKCAEEPHPEDKAKPVLVGLNNRSQRRTVRPPRYIPIEEYVFNRGSVITMPSDGACMLNAIASVITGGMANYILKDPSYNATHPDNGWWRRFSVAIFILPFVKVMNGLYADKTIFAALKRYHVRWTAEWEILEKYAREGIIPVGVSQPMSRAALELMGEGQFHEWPGRVTHGDTDIYIVTRQNVAHAYYRDRYGNGFGITVSNIRDALNDLLCNQNTPLRKRDHICLAMALAGSDIEEWTGSGFAVQRDVIPEESDSDEDDSYSRIPEDTANLAWQMNEAGSVRLRRVSADNKEPDDFDPDREEREPVDSKDNGTDQNAVSEVKNWFEEEIPFEDDQEPAQGIGSILRNTHIVKDRESDRVCVTIDPDDPIINLPTNDCGQKLRWNVNDAPRKYEWYRSNYRVTFLGERNVNRVYSNEVLREPANNNIADKCKRKFKEACRAIDRMCFFQPKRMEWIDMHRSEPASRDVAEAEANLSRVSFFLTRRDDSEFISDRDVPALIARSNAVLCENNSGKVVSAQGNKTFVSKKGWQYTMHWFAGAKADEFGYRESKGIKYNDRLTSYSHPYLRMVSTVYQLKMLYAALQHDTLVIDHASKYHAVSQQCNASNLRMVRYNTGAGYDKMYTKAHPPADGRILTTTAKLAFDTVLPFATHVFHDCIYYPGVIESLANNQGEAYVTSICIPDVQGRYEFFDNEGYVDVYTDTCAFRPKLNPTPYIHALPVLRGNICYIKNKWTSEYRIFVPKEFTMLGDKVFYYLYYSFVSPIKQGEKIVLNRKAIPAKGVLLDVCGEDALIQVKCKPTLASKALAYVKYREDGKDQLADMKTFTAYIHRMPEYSQIDSTEIMAAYTFALNESYKNKIFTQHIHRNIGKQRPGRFVSAWNFLCNLGKRSTIEDEIIAEKKKGFANYENVDIGRKIEYLRSEHYDETRNSRGKLPLGFNKYCKVVNSGTIRPCTCKDLYVKVIENAPTATHFGKCDKNLEAGLKLRQFGARTFPNKDTLRNYKDYVRRVFLPDVFDALRDADYTLDLQDYIASIVPRKRKLYIKAIEEIRAGTARISNKCKVFSKTNEVLKGTQDEGIRPRLIFSPDIPFLVCGSYIARILIREFKKVEDGFISGFDYRKLGEHISSTCERGSLLNPSTDEETINVVGQPNNFFSFDNASHDAHQHPELINLIDNGILKQLLPDLLARSWIPVQYHEELTREMLKMDTMITAENGFRAKCSGTVYSGHPTRTTLFNTLRVLSYVKYACFKMRITARLFVAGDDVFGWTSNVSRLEKGLLKIYNKKEGGNAGLGLLIKDFSVGPIENHTFLSKDIVASGFDIGLYRNYAKLSIAGAYTACISSRISEAEYCAMQAYQLADLPAHQQFYSEPFRRKACRLSDRLKAHIQYQWNFVLNRFSHNKDLEIMHERIHFLSPNNPIPEVVIGRIVRYQDTEKLGPNLSIMSKVNASNKNKGARSKKEKALNNSRRLRDERAVKLPALRRPSDIRLFESAAEMARVYNEGQYNYLLSVIDPDRGAARGPSMVPIPTAVLQFREIFTLTAGTGGSIRVQLNPWFACNSDFLIRAYAGGTCSDTIVGTGSTYTYGASAPVITTYAESFRPTGAKLTVVPSGADQTESGFHALTFYPGPSPPVTTDITTLRDYDTTVITTKHKEQSMSWRPMDSNDFNFGDKGIKGGSVVYTGSGLASGQTVTFRVVVNFEYIVKSSYADLLNPECGAPFSSDDVGLGKYSNTASINQEPTTLGNKVAAEIKSQLGRSLSYVYDGVKDTGKKALLSGGAFLAARGVRRRMAR